MNPLLFLLDLAILGGLGALVWRMMNQKKEDVTEAVDLPLPPAPSSSYSIYIGTPDLSPQKAFTLPPPISLPPPTPIPTSYEPALMWRFFDHHLLGSYRGDWSRGYLEADCNGNSGFWDVSRLPSYYDESTPGVRSHTSPVLWCTCGIYGYKRPHTQGLIVALTAGFGKYIEHERGYRVQYGQIIGYTHVQSYPVPQWDHLGIPHVRSIERLLRVEDFFRKNPDKLWDEIERLGLERSFRTE